MSSRRTEHDPNWSYEPLPVENQCIQPLQFPLSPGSNYFMPSGYNDGFFIPPGYDNGLSPFHTSYCPNCRCEQSPFGPDSTSCFPPEYNGNIFIPPGYNSWPSHMNHQWSNFSTDQQDLVYGRTPNHGLANPEINMTDCFTDSSSIDTLEYEPGLASQHCPAMFTMREEQLDITEENQHANNVNKVDLVPGKYLEKPGRMQMLSSESTHQQNGELIIWEAEVPKHLTGALIGKEARYLKFVKWRCGGMVYLSIHPHTQDYMICNIMGTKNQVNKALELIWAKVKYHDLKNIYSPPPVTFGAPLSDAQFHHG